MKITKVVVAVAYALAVLVAITSEPVPAEATVTPTTGKFEFTFTITLSSTIATTTQIGCFVQLEVTGDTVTAGIVDTAGNAATRSGSTATCTVDVPYSWKLGTPKIDKVTLLYTIEAPVLGGAYAVPYRSVHGNLGTIAVPGDGATTTETIDATI
ncbi:MAG: hypothetical protein ACLPHP_10505 [Candidatus Sulfotelmatobacter sp.]